LVFTGLARGLVHRFKYSGDVALTPFFGSLLTQVWQAQEQAVTPDAIVPVPLHWYRQLRRGYNQSALLAGAFSAQASMPLVPMLTRRKHTRAQASLSLAQRRRNLAGSFAVTVDQDPTGMNLLLVDDVFTTGSTLDACTRSLLKAGAKGVQVITLARG
jgi:ComF family protein